MNASLLRKVRNFTTIALFLAMSGIWFGNPSVAHADGYFIVNSSADTVGMDSELTLVEAIRVANGVLTGPFSDPERDLLQGSCTFSGSSDNWFIDALSCGWGVPDSITFHSAINLVTTTACFENLTDAGTTIDGGSPGHVVIDATGCNAMDVFTVDSNDITIKNLSIINTALGMSDIRIMTGRGAVIAYNRLGMQYSSTYCDAARNGTTGVGLSHTTGSSGIGNGSAYIYGNLIGCHHTGVFVYGADFVYIGVDRSGANAGNYIGSYLGFSFPNSGNGVALTDESGDGADYNTMANNWIANSSFNGILVYNSSANTISANIIGLGANGAAAPNALDGVRILGIYAGMNMIGGSTSASQNIISGNSQSGVHLLDSAHLNSIQGNWIGTNLDNTGYVPNGLAGIAIENGAYSNSIGDPLVSSAYQLIRGNTREGIYIGDNVINTRVGRMNFISGNGLGGVVVGGNSSTDNYIQPFMCSSNGGLPIDLGDDGHTPNDTGDGDTGPNTLLNYPEVTSVSGQVVNGNTCAGCEVSFYLAMGNPSALGGGGTYFGSVTASGSGAWSVDLSSYAFLTPANMSLVAYQAGGGSSEMSPVGMVYLPLVIR